MDQKHTYYIFCLTGIIIAFNVASISAVVPSIADDLGVSDFTAGRIIWAYMIPYGICALLYGPLSRIFSIKQILAVCLSAVAFFSFLSGMAHTFASLFVYRFMVGIFAAAMTPLTLLYIAHAFDMKERGSRVGAFFSSTFVASLAGLLLSGIVHWRYIFFIPAVLCILTVALIVKLFPEISLSAEGVKSRYGQALKTRRVSSIFIYIFSISFLYHLARQWMGVYFSQAHHLSLVVISMLLTLESFAGIFGEVFGGRLADKKGRVLSLSVGGLLMTAAILVLPVSAKVFFLACTLFIWGFGWTVNHAACSTYLTDLPKPYMQEVTSLNSSVRFLAGGIGAATGGFFMQQSFVSTFLAVGILLLFLSVSSMFLLRV